MKRTAENIISLKNINKSFPLELGGEQQVLFDINFTIKAGEFVAIMGPSGSGKSTCMNIIGALDTASSGVYELYGRDVTGLTPDELATVRNEYIGFVFQQFNLLPKRSVLDNVMLPLMYRGLPMSERIDRAREMLKRVGLENFESYLAEESDVEKAYLIKEQKILLHRVMRELKSEYFQVLYLVYFEDFTNAEIAKIMKKNKRQVENLIYRAKTTLRSELEKEGFEDENL